MQQQVSDLLSRDDLYNKRGSKVEPFVLPKPTLPIFQYDEEKL